MPKVIERQGGVSVPHTRMLPQVRGGTCEFCGVVDPNRKDVFQYQLCPHFRDLGEIQCSYCEEAKDPHDVIKKSVVKVHEHPSNPDLLVVVCDDYRCAEKHLARFKVSA